MTTTKTHVGTMSLYRAVAKGTITPEQAGEFYVQQLARESAPKSRKPAFVPTVVWSLLIVMIGLFLLPTNQRS